MEKKFQLSPVPDTQWTAARSWPRIRNQRHPGAQTAPNSHYTEASQQRARLQTELAGNMMWEWYLSRRHVTSDEMKSSFCVRNASFIGNKRIPLKKSLCQNLFTRTTKENKYCLLWKYAKMQGLGLHLFITWDWDSLLCFCLCLSKVQSLLSEDFSLLKRLNDRLMGLQHSVCLWGPSQSCHLVDNVL